MKTLQWIPEYFGWILLLIVILSVLFSWWIYKKQKNELSNKIRFLLTALRTLTLVLSAVLLVHPQIILTTTEMELPTLNIWIDKSGSMDKNLSIENEKKLITAVKDFANDSINYQIKYFAQTIRDEDQNSKSWRSQTNFSPIVRQSTAEINIVATDGHFNDYQWLLEKPETLWNIVFIGDTTRRLGFELKPINESKIEIYEGDWVTLSVLVNYNLAKTDSAEVEFKLTDTTVTKKIKPTNLSGSEIISSAVNVKTAGEYSYEINLTSQNRQIIKNRGTIVVKPRLQQVYIVSSEIDPLIGFFKRHLTKIGNTKVDILLDNDLTNLSHVKLKSQAAFILINYPQKETNLFKEIKSRLQQSNMLLVSNQLILPEVQKLILPTWKPFPAFTVGQKWQPISDKSENSHSFYAGWSGNDIKGMPPFTTSIGVIPSILQTKSNIMVDQQILNYPYEIIEDGATKRAWLLKGNFDEWQRWDALNNIVPPKISLSAIQFLTWLLTPTESKLPAISFHSLANENGLEAILNLTTFKSSDSLTINLSWNENIYPMNLSEKQLYRVRLPEVDKEKTPYTYHIIKKEKLISEYQGMYIKPLDTEEKDVLGVALEPVSTWIKANNGWISFQTIDFKKLKEQMLYKTKSKVIQSHFNSWDNFILFALLVLLVSSEWLIRKRMGAL